MQISTQRQWRRSDGDCTHSVSSAQASWRDMFDMPGAY